MSNLIKFIPDIKDQILNIVSVLSQEQNWGLSYIDVQDAWKHNKGQNVRIAVIDTGWFPHKDLVANFEQGFDATGNNDYLDHGNFHGVHVSGIIAANSSEDIFGVTGVAPESKLIPIKALDNDGNGSYDYIATALSIVKNLDIDIINMSLGAPIMPNDESLHNIIKELAAQGKIIVCAAGNDGGSVNYPAKYDETIAVAAIQNDGTMAKFSSRGPELDTAAPGVHIYSTWGNNQYINLDGTSMACPCITGVLALIISWMKSSNKQSDINVKNMIKILQDLGSKDNGHRITQIGQYDISVPEFCNMRWD
jgi:subtilisin family serine protease